MTASADVFWTRTWLLFTIVFVTSLPASADTDFLLLNESAMITRTSVLPLLILTLSLSTGSRLLAQGSDSSGIGDRLFQQDPDTTSGLLRSAFSASRLDRTQTARRYLQLILDQRLSGAALLQLRHDVGMEIVLRLNANPDLQPMAGQLLDQLNEAAASSRATSEQSVALVGQLGQSSEQTRAAAASLLTIGHPAAAALLTADFDSPSGEIAWDLLRRYPRTFRFGLLDALVDASPQQQQRGLELLGASADAELAPLLLEYQFAAESAEVRRAAASAVERLWSGSDRPKDERHAVDWLVQRAEKSLAIAADRYAADREIALARAVRLASIADAIDSGGSLSTQAVLTACLAASGDPIDAIDDAELRQAAVDVAIRAENSTAAVALMNSDTDTLRQAMLLPGAEVRVRASSQLLALNERVRGVAMAQEMITDAAEGSVRPEAVVIDARLDQAAEGVWLLDSLGYEAARCLTGKAGFEQAVRQLNCELILVHANCLRWPLSQTIANLRADSRTAQTPIAVYGPRRVRSSLQQVQRLYPGIYLLPGPLSEINFADELRRSGVPGPELTEQQRQELIELAGRSQ